MLTETSSETIIAAGATATISVDCLTGDKVTGGGYTSSSTSSLAVLENGPSDADTWTVTARNPTGASITLTVTALCVDL